jgi:hypothetical protein
MPRKIVTVTHTDGTKKVIIGQPSNKILVKTRELEEDRRPKPVTPKISISKEKNGYKYGGKIKCKTR